MTDEKRHLKLVAEQEPVLSASALALEDVEVTDGLLQVGELARETGKTVRAIHLYESLGLIEPARRSKGRYRLFSPEARVRVRWISKLQSLGLSLSEIQAIALRRSSQETALLASSELLSVYKEKLDEIRGRIAEYQALEQELELSVAFLQTCQHACVSEVHISGCSQCERHQEESAQVPELVVGAQVTLAGASVD